MATMVKLQTVTVGSGGASSIDFTNIPQTYTDLFCLVSLRTSVSNSNTWIKFNSTSTGYTGRQLYGTGAGTGSSSLTNADIGPLSNDSGFTASVFSNSSFYIPNYTSSNYKSYDITSISENNGTTAYQNMMAGLWSNTAAITSISIVPSSGSFVQYSTATLYGVKALTTATGTGKALGGDQVYTDGTYWYHIYTTVGTSSFTPLTSLTADYLVVAGGGGGSYTGGGGAGGVRCTVGATGGGGSLESALSLTAQAYTVTVGGGGAGSISSQGTNGSNSVFASITSTGGGGGGVGDTAPTGKDGGSGGGGAFNTSNPSTNYSGGNGTTNQGYAGGYGRYSGTQIAGGGGGGAGAAGANVTPSSGTVTAAGNGGNGITTSISGTSTTYGGGGGGGGRSVTASSGGTGGGGAGGISAAGTNGTANTGGGGGGGFTTSAGNGGSGIVIVRYAV